MNIDGIKDLISERVSNSDFNHIIKFDCGDDGILVVNNNTVTTEDTEAECTVGVTIDDLLAMVKGEMNPTMGFMTGKLKLDGNMGVAMKLGQLL